MIKGFSGTKVIKPGWWNIPAKLQVIAVASGAVVAKVRTVEPLADSREPGVALELAVRPVA